MINTIGSMHGLAAHREVVTGEVGGCVHVHRYHDEEHQSLAFRRCFLYALPCTASPCPHVFEVGCPELRKSPHWNTRACTKAMHEQISGCHRMHRRGGQPFKGCERASACVSLNNMFGHVLTACAAHDGTPHRCGLLRTRGTLEMPHASLLRTCSAVHVTVLIELDCEPCEEGEHVTCSGVGQICGFRVLA
jgi:hypothetical protein